jgi:hypothetical protein
MWVGQGVHTNMWFGNFLENVYLEDREGDEIGLRETGCEVAQCFVKWRAYIFAMFKLKMPLSQCELYLLS